MKELSNKRLFVVDAFCGANKDTRMAIRFIMEVAWQAHFVTNMFITSHRGRAEELRAGLRRLQRLQGEGGELQGTRPQLRDRRRLQPHHPRAGDCQHLVRRRDEEGHVLHDELLPAAQGHGFHALLRQHGHERREHRDFLRSFRHRQDHAVHRPEAPADRRRRARLGRQRRVQLRRRLLREGYQPR